MLTEHATCVEYPFSSYYRPFSADSPWNSRPFNPILDETKTIPTDQYVPVVSGGDWSTGVYQTSNADPPLTVFGCTSKGIAIPDIAGYQPSITIPHWPSSAVPAAGTDGHCEIYDMDAKIIHSFWQLNRTSDLWCASLYSWTKLDGSGFGNPSQYYQGARAAAVVSSAGLIRKHEIDDGDSMYRHALTISLTYSGLSKNPTYVWPATHADSNAEYENSGTIPEGALLLLPQSFNASALKTVKLRKVAETLKYYGAYVTDRNFGTPYGIFVEMGAGFNLYPNGWDGKVADELQAIRAALRPMKSCSGYLNGEGKVINYNLNQNILSMRGIWVLGSGGPLGVFDTWKQAIVFSNRTVKTVQNNGNGNGFTPVTWAKAVTGQLYNLTAVTTGGGQFRMFFNLACRNMSNIDSGNLNNGQSFVFTWPGSSCWHALSAISGVNQESTVAVQLLKVEVPTANSVNPSSSNSVKPSNSQGGGISPIVSSRSGGSTSPRMNSSESTHSYSTHFIIMLLLLLAISF